MSLSGFVILIPLDDSESQVAHVLFELKSMKDVGLIAIPQGGKNADPTQSADEYIDYFWVGLAPIRQKKWSILGEFEVPDVTYYTRCILGGWVCEKDKEIRPARENDYKDIPRFQPHPRIAAEARLKKLHNKAKQAGTR